MAVFVTDGDQRATLAVVRSLGRAGIRVVVGHSAARSLAGSSRYCARGVCYPSPWERPREFQQFLRQEMHSGDYRLLLPMTDVTTLLAAPLQTELPASVCLPIGEEACLRRVQDKAAVLQIAETLGIAVPTTVWSSAASSMPSKTPASTSQTRRRLTVSPSSRRWPARSDGSAVIWVPPSSQHVARARARRAP